MCHREKRGCDTSVVLKHTDVQLAGFILRSSDTGSFNFHFGMLRASAFVVRVAAGVPAGTHLELFTKMLQKEVGSHNDPSYSVVPLRFSRFVWATLSTVFGVQLQAVCCFFVVGCDLVQRMLSVYLHSVLLALFFLLVVSAGLFDRLSAIVTRSRNGRPSRWWHDLQIVLPFLLLTSDTLQLLSRKLPNSEGAVWAVRCRIACHAWVGLRLCTSAEPRFMVLPGTLTHCLCLPAGKIVLSVTSHGTKVGALVVGNPPGPQLLFWA